MRSWNKAEAILMGGGLAGAFIITGLLFTDLAKFEGVFIGPFPRSIVYMIIIGLYQLFLGIFLFVMYPKYVDKGENKGKKEGAE